LSIYEEISKQENYLPCGCSAVARCLRGLFLLSRCSSPKSLTCENAVMLG